MSKNSLTPEDLENKIIDENYSRIGLKTTVCCLTLANGFEVVGSSAPVSLDNFDEQKGREVARLDALGKTWMIEGYLLQENTMQTEAREYIDADA